MLERVICFLRISGIKGYASPNFLMKYNPVELMEHMVSKALGMKDAMSPVDYVTVFLFSACSVAVPTTEEVWEGNSVPQCLSLWRPITIHQHIWYSLTCGQLIRNYYNWTGRHNHFNYGQYIAGSLVMRYVMSPIWARLSSSQLQLAKRCHLLLESYAS